MIKPPEITWPEVCEVIDQINAIPEAERRNIARNNLLVILWPEREDLENAQNRDQHKAPKP